MRRYRSVEDMEISGDVVRGMFLHRLTIAELAERIGMSGEALRNRLHGRTRWTAAEAGRARRALELPRLDSNQQPAGYGSAA